MAEKKWISDKKEWMRQQPGYTEPKYSSQSVGSWSAYVEKLETEKDSNEGEDND